jgi:hypothetical protein
MEPAGRSTVNSPKTPAREGRRRFVNKPHSDVGLIGLAGNLFKDGRSYLTGFGQIALLVEGLVSWW